jgi:hypothetical protein
VAVQGGIVIDDRTYHDDIAAAPALRRLGGRVAHLAATTPTDFDAVTTTLIDVGDFCAAVLDELLPHADDLHPAAALWTAPVTSLARASDAAWRSDAAASEAALQTAIAAIDACGRSYVPREVTLRRSNGFPPSTPGPQVFAEAAREWALARPGSRVVCFGLRSGGVTLAAAAAAGLLSRRVDVSVMTVRVRGTSLDRSVLLTPRFRRAIQEWADVTFLVVDDGPIAGGAPLSCAADALAALGVDDHRIVLMPGEALSPGAVVASERGRLAILAPDLEPAWVAARRPLSAMTGGLVVEGGMAG